MAIFDLFSKRQQRLRGEVADVYQYEDISQEFRVQVIHIIQDTIGHEEVLFNEELNPSGRLHRYIHKVLCKEYGVFDLWKADTEYSSKVYNYFLGLDNFEQCLDIIEVSFKVINTVLRNNQGLVVNQAPDNAIEELNARFKEAGLGYQFESGEIIRVDSQFIHSETVKPVLRLLGANKLYKGANDEFLSAHEHYRHKRYKECLVDCLKSFESLMKVICEKHSWAYGQTDTAKKLINVCLSNNLAPEYLQNQFTSVRTLLESGIPTIRNKEGGHGQARK